MKTKLSISILATLMALASTVEAQPFGARRPGTAPAGRTSPNLLGGRMYDQDGVGFTRLVRADWFNNETTRRGIRPGVPFQSTRQPGDMSVPREGTRIDYQGIDGSVTGPNGQRYLLARFRDLSNPTVNTGSRTQTHWTIPAGQGQRDRYGRPFSFTQDGGSQQGAARGWKFGGTVTKTSSKTTSSRSGTTSSKPHQSGGIIKDPPQR